jgi:hypothetical protein
MVFCKAAMGSEPLDPKQLTAQNAKMLSWKRNRDDCSTGR